MKQIYPATGHTYLKPLTLLAALSLCALSFSASAQTYAHTYQTTPVLAGTGPYYWSTASPNAPIWESQHGQPPASCNNCLIQLVGPGVIHLNTAITLSGNSSLVVGSGVTLVIDNSGQTNTFTGANAINLVEDNSTNNTLVLTDNTSTLDATAAGQYDGVFFQLQSSPVVSEKQFGTFGDGNDYSFLGNTAESQKGAAYNSPATGFVTLSSGPGILPIILTDFTAAVNQGAVDLNWTTQMEQNSDHFTVERSTDAGATWTTIGTVAAAGNSSTPLNYSYADSKPVQGTSEYRLVLVDKDGTFTYSQVAGIHLGTVTSVSLYPNPARDYVNVTLGSTPGQDVLIRLFNQSGALLVERNVSNAGGTVVPMAVSSYPEGNYIIVVSAADGSHQVNKLLITK